MINNEWTKKMQDENEFNIYDGISNIKEYTDSSFTKKFTWGDRPQFYVTSHNIFEEIFQQKNGSSLIINWNNDDIYNKTYIYNIIKNKELKENTNQAYYLNPTKIFYLGQEQECASLTLTLPNNIQELEERLKFIKKICVKEEISNLLIDESICTVDDKLKIAELFKVIFNKTTLQRIYFALPDSHSIFEQVFNYGDND